MSPERALADAAPRAYWLDRPDVPAPATRPSASDLPVAERRVDLVVVGGGLTGLWTAFEAARTGVDVLVLEAGSLASGASGKCGGFVNASITHGIPHGHARWPSEMERIVALQEALWDNTLSLMREHGASDVIDPCGKYTVATSAHHVRELATSVDVLHRYGQEVALLDGEAMRERIASPGFAGGYHLATANGLCDPARLAWAIAAMAEAAGARLAERSAVTGLRDTGTGVEVQLAGGTTVHAGCVLLATNASPPLLRRLRAWVIPVYDHVIVTEPLTPGQWHEIGWRHRAGITDAGNQFHYYRPTPDGRILYGGWDATYHFGGRVDPSHEQRPATHRLLVEHLRATFPALENVRVSHAWGGPIDSTSRFTPTFGTTRSGRIAWAVGFTGLGVGASRFGALTALDLLAGRDTERTELSMVRRAPIPFPPEPLRWPLVQVTKRALQREDRTGRRGPWLRLLDRFGVGFDT